MVTLSNAEFKRIFCGDLWLKDRGVVNERVNQVSGTADAE